MPAERLRRASWRSVARLLTPRDRRFLLALLLPTGLLTVLAGLSTIADRFDATSGLQWWQLAAGHLVWHLVCAVAWVLAFALVRGRWTHLALALIAQAGVLIHLLVSLAATAYHHRTGSLLDLDTIRYVLAAPGDFTGVVATAVDARHVVAVAAVCAWTLVGPWLVSRGLPQPVRRPLKRRSGAALALGLAATALVVTPSLAANPYASPRTAAVLNSAAGALRPSAAGQTGADWRQDATLVAGDRGAARPENVVMIVTESVRSSATTDGSWGELDTTPNLTKLARTSTSATQAYPVVPHTSKALTGLNCGVAPDPATSLSETARGVPVNCLPRLLGEQGYRSAFVQSAVGHFEDRASLVEEFGYDEFYGLEDLPSAGYQPANYFGYEDDIMLAPTRDWLRQDERPFLLTYLTVTAHHDYAVPQGFETRDLAEDPEVNDYLNTVAYTDRFVGKVLEQLEDLGLAEDTLVVVVGDHGEGFGEHGLRQHDNTIYEEGVRVPLIVHDPTDPRGRVIDTPMNTTTVAASVIERLGYAVQGTQPAPAMERWDGPARVYCHSQDACLARIDADGKYIHHFGRRADEFFDLAADPGERENRIGELDAATTSQWRQELLEARRGMRAAYRDLPLKG